MTPWSWVLGRAAGWRRGRWRGLADRSCWWSAATTRTRITWLETTFATPEPTADWTTGRCGRRRDNPRTVLMGADAVVLPAWDPRYGSNADTFGGGTRVYGAQAWRFVPEDFAMATTYGVPDGSALADWPIGYDDLEPFYTAGRVRDRRLRLRGPPRRVEPALTPLPHGADVAHRA